MQARSTPDDHILTPGFCEQRLRKLDANDAAHAHKMFCVLLQQEKLLSTLLF